jgi:hypothetical protein
VRCVCIGGPKHGREINIPDKSVERTRYVDFAVSGFMWGRARYERFGDVLLMIVPKSR